MKIEDKFSENQLELLEKNNIDISIDFNKNTLEELEDIIYNLMMDNLDEKQNFTSIALQYEKILDIIVEIENNL